MVKDEKTGENLITEKELQGFNEAYVAFKAANDKHEADLKAHGIVNGELKEKAEKLEKIVGDMEAAYNKRFDELEARANRKSREAGTSAEEKDHKIKVKGAYFNYFRQRALNDEVETRKAFDEYKTVLGPEKVKVLSVGNNPLGGYVTAPSEFVEELIVDLQEQNPVRGLFRQRNTDRKSVTVPKQIGFLTASWTAEQASRTETTGTLFNQVEIPTHEQHAQVNVTREELEDTFFPMEAFLRAQFVEQFARAEGVAFVDGNGVHKPEGFTVNADVTAIQSSGSGVFTADDLISLLYNNIDAYSVNGTFVMKRATLKLVRQLKDGQGQYLWAPALARDARPSTLLDKPVVLADQMPASSGTNKPISYGDFRVGYIVVDRLMLEMIVDPFTSKSTGTIEFSARKRVGGQLIQPQAVQSLQLAA